MGGTFMKMLSAKNFDQIKILLNMKYMRAYNTFNLILIIEKIIFFEIFIATCSNLLFYFWKIPGNSSNNAI